MRIRWSKQKTIVTRHEARTVRRVRDRKRGDRRPKVFTTTYPANVERKIVWVGRTVPGGFRVEVVGSVGYDGWANASVCLGRNTGHNPPLFAFADHWRQIGFGDTASEAVADLLKKLPQLLRTELSHLLKSAEFLAGGLE